jgi:hypothetical protein
VSRAVRRLTKRDVETLLERYDADPVGALSTALRRVLPEGAESAETSGTDDSEGRGTPADAEWACLVRAAEFDPQREAALLAGDQVALDALAAELNELRTLARSSDGGRRRSTGS